MWPFRKKEASLSAPSGMPRERISREDFPLYSNFLESANKYLSVVDPRVPREFLDIIEKLAIINPDFSQTVTDIVTLANTGHEIEIEAQDENQIRKTADLSGPSGQKD